MRHRQLIQASFACTAISMLCISCASVPFFGSRADSDTTDSTAEPGMEATASTDDREAALRRIVAESIERANSGHEAQRSDLVRKEPYFYKEYEYYPDGPSAIELSIRETESRTAPYVADVEASKQRFVTKLHRKRDEARIDEDFLRDTGVETTTYEMRNGRWRRVGSLFVAGSVERNIDGVWTPVVEEVERTAETEEEELGWFGRVWSAVVGR